MPIETAPDQKYPELLSDMAAKVTALLIGEGIALERAPQLAFGVVELIRRDWGGTYVYVPLGAAYNAQERAREVYRRWNRLNTLELVREFGVSVGRLRQLYNIGRKLAEADAAAAALDREPPSQQK